MAGVAALPAFLVDKANGERLEFQYIEGAKIVDEIVPGFFDQKVIGSTHPRIGWGAGGGRNWTLKLKFYAEDSTLGATWVRDQCRWLQARLLPEYGPTQLLKTPPHLCIFSWGDLFDAQVVVRKATPTYGPLYTIGELLPVMAEVDIRLDEYETGSRGFETISPTGGTP